MQLTKKVLTLLKQTGQRARELRQIQALRGPVRMRRSKITTARPPFLGRNADVSLCLEWHFLVTSSEFSFYSNTTKKSILELRLYRSNYILFVNLFYINNKDNHRINDHTSNGQNIWVLRDKSSLVIPSLTFQSLRPAIIEHQKHHGQNKERALHLNRALPC